MTRPNSPYLRGGLSFAIIVGAQVFVSSSPAYAQDTLTEPGSITVTAPRRVQVGRSTIGAPIDLISLSRFVNFSDVDLRTPAGQAELDKRAMAAARSACQELERQYPNGTPDSLTCAKQARAATQGQIDAAIAAALQPPPPASPAPKAGY